MFLRHALITDAKDIQQLVNTHAAKGDMLSLSMNDIYERIMEFVLADTGGVKGCCSLRPMWSDLAEIRSLAVHEDFKRQGIGRALVERQIERASKLGFLKVFTLTYKVEFFNKLGFTELSKDDLPKKIWTDCLKCIKYPDCDETAMIFNLLRT